MQLVGRDEREQPAHALVRVRPLDEPNVVGGQVEPIGELPLDHEEGHRPMVARVSRERARAGVRRWPLRFGLHTRSYAGSRARGSRRCAR